MYLIKSHISQMKPLLVLIYLSAMGFLSIFSVQMYLGLEPSPLSSLSFMGIIFGVYTLNRFTDNAEDFTNDIGRLLFFQKRKVFLLAACTSLFGCIGFLLYVEKLNWMHLLLLGMGFSYSYRILPWRSQGEFRLLRIKDITLLKNLSVSFLWGASVFVVPILYSGAPFDFFPVFLLSSGLFISTLNNTLFDDVLDEAGDRVAGIKTLPTTWGNRKSLNLLIAVDLLWLAGLAGLRALGLIESPIAIFLVLLGLYPFVYIGMYLTGKGSKGLIDFISETDLLFFALGMLALSVFR